MVLVWLLLGCSDETAVVPPPPIPDPQSVCPPGERQVAENCIAAGIQDDGCPAGTLGDNGACVAPGVPPEACAPGFEPQDDGCRAILPATPCVAGQLAQLGEMSCHEVAPCGMGTWGDIALDSSTEHVDITYTVGDGDGTAAKPWPTIQQAIDAAASGATVAIAQGSYAEDLTIDGKAVVLWGRCPSLVTVAGSGSALAAVSVTGSADGTVIRGVGVSGAAAGIRVVASMSASVDRVWIHDTAGYGIDARLGGAQATSVLVTDTLVESTHERGVYAEGVSAHVERSVIRDTLPSASEVGGRGVNARDDTTTHARSSLELVSSIVERSHEAGVLVHASDAVLDGSLVIDTRPGSNMRFGRAVAIQVDPSTTASARAEVRRCRIEQALDGGIFSAGSDVVVEHTTIVDIAMNLDEAMRGYGINTDYYPPTDLRGNLTLTASVIDRATESAIFIGGSDALIESVVVRDTRPVAGRFGRGMSLQRVPVSAESSIGVMRGSLVTRSTEVAVFVEGSELIIEGTRVEHTTPVTGQLNFGRGLHAQELLDDATRGTLEVIACELSDNQEVALSLKGSDGSVSGTRVTETRERPDGLLGVGMAADWSSSTHSSLLTISSSSIGVSVTAAVLGVGSRIELFDSAIEDVAPVSRDGSFGDGIALMSMLAPASARIERSAITRAERSGVSSFGAAIELVETTVDCNGLDLSADTYDNQSGIIVDGGGNRCGCSSEERTCRAVAANLTAPQQPPTLD